MMTSRAAMEAKEMPPMTAWNRKSWGATNMKANSRGSVMPETTLAATPAIIRALTLGFFSSGEVR